MRGGKGKTRVKDHEVQGSKSPWILKCTALEGSGQAVSRYEPLAHPSPRPPSPGAEELPWGSRERESDSDPPRGSG